MDQNNESPRVVFEEEFRPSAQSFQTPTSKIVNWVIKYSGGFIKDENQANYFLIGFIVLAVIISLFLFFNSGGAPPLPIPPAVPVSNLGPLGQQMMYI